MFSLINLEIKKYWRLKTLIVTIIFVLIGIYFVAINEKYYATVHEQSKSFLQDKMVKLSEENIKNYTEEIDKLNKKGDAYTAKKLEGYKKEEEERLEISKLERDAKTKEDRFNLNFRRAELSFKVLNSQSNQGSLGTIKDYELYKQYKDKNIIPEDAKLTALNFVKDYPSQLNVIIVSVLIMVLVGDCMSFERGSTLVGYLSQPITKRKFILSKFIAAIVVSVVIFTSIEILIFIIMGLKNGWGPLSSPTSFMARYNTGRSLPQYIPNSQGFISGYKFTVYLFLIQILYISALTSIGFLVSVISEKASTAISVNIGIILIAYTLVYKAKIIPYMQKYIFSSYADIAGLISGELQFKRVNSSLTLQSGIISMILTTIICLIASRIIFRKQEIYF